jgi:hypothetical protein
VEAALGGLAAAILSVVTGFAAILPLVIGDYLEGDFTENPRSINQIIEEAFFFGLSKIPGILIVLIPLMLFIVTAWGRFALARAYFGLTRQLPFRLMMFLEKKRHQGIVRQTGPAFQFRHLKLRDRLAMQSEPRPR